MLTDDGDGMIGVLAVNGVVGVTAADGIGSLIDDFDGICTSFNINSFTSLLLLDRRGNEKINGNDILNLFIQCKDAIWTYLKT